MLKNSRARTAVTAALVAAAVGASGAGTANAAPVTVTDDAAADFAQGTPAGTVVRTIAGDGAIELTRTLETQFDGSALPAGWTSTAWTPNTGATTVSSGSMLVDGTRADSNVLTGPGSSLEFTATLGNDTFTHVGFGTDFGVEPWAIFSTGGGDVPFGLYARTSDGTGGADNLDFPVSPLVASPTDPHTYRIDWTATGFDYYVDGALVVTHPMPLTASMRPQASDFNVGSGGVSVDSMILNTHTTPGTFISRPLDAGDARVAGASLTATSTLPAGTAITYEVRMATSLVGLADASFTALGAGGTITTPAQFVQYKATLNTTNAAATPKLDKVAVVFTIDDQAPAVTISDVAVSTGTARVKFSSDDAGATTKCKLDDGAFADCTSPATFSGLAHGSHKVVVQATDAHTNVGSATKMFDVDTHAPSVAISDVAVSGATAKVTFSSDDAGAAVMCRLDGGALQNCASPAPFAGLAAGSHTVVVQATDAQGNVGSATRTFDVAAPSGGGTPAVDVTAPKVRLTPRSVVVSSRGDARIRISCPRAELRCAVTVKLELNGKTIARKTLKLAGGTTRSLALRLSRAARAQLAARAHVKVAAVITARDAAGNHRRAQLTMTLRAPSH